MSLTRPDWALTAGRQSPASLALIPRPRDPSVYSSMTPTGKLTKSALLSPVEKRFLRPNTVSAFLWSPHQLNGVKMCRMNRKFQIFKINLMGTELTILEVNTKKADVTVVFNYFTIWEYCVLFYMFNSELCMTIMDRVLNCESSEHPKIVWTRV